MDFHVGLIFGLGMILCQRHLDNFLGIRIAFEEFNYLVVGLRAEDTQKRGDRELALAVNTTENSAVSVGFDLHPYTASWYDLGTKIVLAFDLITSEENTEGTSQLWSDDAFDAIDDESAVIRHQRDLREKHFLLFDHIERFVLESYFDFDLTFKVELVILGKVLVELW